MTKIMERREYQLSAVSRVTERLKNGERVVLVAPTGSGKTYMGALIALAAWGRVLWVAHRRELLHQAAAQFRDLGQDVGVLSAYDNENPDARVLAVTPAYAARYVARAQFVVVDECHRSTATTYRKLLENRALAVLGMTATPWRLDGVGLSTVYTSIELAAQPSALIAQGHMARPLTYGISAARASAMVSGVAYLKGEFNAQSLSAAMMKATIVGDIIEERERLGGDRKTVVFAVTRAHARRLTYRFRKAGRTAAWVDSSQPKKVRERTLAAFTAGAVQILVNVDIVSEGFDLASIQCVSIARPTRSLTRYLQYVGRACRPYGEAATVVIDHVGNVWRHGLPEWDREWSLDGHDKNDQPEYTERGILLCPECGCCNEPGTQACVECAHDLSASRRLLEDGHYKLQLLSPGKAVVACLTCKKPTCNPMFCTPKCYYATKRAPAQCSKCGDDMIVPKYKLAHVAAPTCRKCIDRARSIPPRLCACGKPITRVGSATCSLKCRDDVGSVAFACIDCGKSSRISKRAYSHVPKYREEPLGDRCKECRQRVTRRLRYAHVGK